MVARLNNDTAPYYALYRQTPPVTETVSVPDYVSPAADEEPQGYSPLLAAAQTVLRQRLAILAEDCWHLDGRPASLKAIVDAANRTVRELGGRYLSYPGLRSRYQQGAPAMILRSMLPA